MVTILAHLCHHSCMSIRRPHDHLTVRTMLTVTPIDPLHKSDGSNGVKGAAEEDKNRRWGLTGLTGPCPWAKRKSSPSLVWNPWWNKGPIWIGQSIGKILEEYLKDRKLFTMNNLSTTFRIPEGRVLQGNNLGYKEMRQNLTTIKAPIPSHIKVRIIDPFLPL